LHGMDGLRRWYRTSVFPDALQRAQVVVSGLVGFLTGIVSDVVKDRFPSYVPDWFVVTPPYMWGAVGVVLTLLVVLFISDAKRTTQLMALSVSIRALRTGRLVSVRSRQNRPCLKVVIRRFGSLPKGLLQPRLRRGNSSTAFARETQLDFLPELVKRWP
jgi:hypothetical protein